MAAHTESETKSPMNFVFPDELSNSTPHIFLDSADNSVNSNWTKTSTAHMFLSYANPEGSSHGPSEARLRSAVPSKTTRRKRRSQNSTPHLFLPYAGDSVARSSVWEGMEKEIERFAAWDGSLEDFEIQCMTSMRNEHLLPITEATSVAVAIRNAVKEATLSENSNLSNQYSKYALFLNKALKPKNQEREGCDDDDRSLTVQDLSDSNNKTTSSSTTIGSLKRQSRKQQEEIDFLRCALKELILRGRRKEVVDQPNHGTQEAGEPSRGGINQETLDVGMGVPRNIEIPKLQEVIDDMSEPASQLTPSEGDMPAPTAYLQLRQRETRDTHYPVFNNSHCWDQVQRCVPYAPILDFDARKMSVTASADYVQTLQVVYKSRSENQRRSSYTDMAKGEVQTSRARGMYFELHFQNLGLSIKGKYSGPIRNGLPHGSGVLRFDNRDMYIGEFVNGRLHGEGTLFSRRRSRLVTLRGKFCRNEFIESSSDDTISAGAA